MSTLGEENIKITTSGVMRAEQQLNRLGESMSKIGGLVRMITAGGALSVGAILRTSMSDTAEGDRFSKAMENLARSMGEGFADRVRQATNEINKLAQAYRQLKPETQTMVADIALAVVGISGLSIALGTVARGISGVVGLLSSTGIASALGPLASYVAVVGALAAEFLYLKQAFTGAATEISKWQFEISRGWVLTVGTIMNKLGVISDKDMGFINQRIGAEQEARRKAAAGAAGGAAGGGGDLRGFTPFIKPEFQTSQAGWERLMKGLAASDPLADVAKAQLGKLEDIDQKIGAGLGAVEKLDQMIPAVR